MLTLLAMSLIEYLVANKILQSCKSIFIYCKLGNFRENFVLANSVKTHTCDVENSRQRCDLRLSIIDRVI